MPKTDMEDIMAIKSTQTRGLALLAFLALILIVPAGRAQQFDAWFQDYQERTAEAR